MLELINKKAIALYRVSTEKQTSKEDKDIPAQKELVHEFVNKNQLILIKEFTEGGISGYKTKMKDRDALVAIKKMALNKEFDVLIVYKSDRIGRTSDESPLVIKYLNDQGIRVVTCSGEEIKTHTQIDKLMTYLTFWQNESESVKLSERATDYQILQLKNGKYRGGGKKTLPFGYRLVNKGTVNFKGKNILDFEIDSEEAEIVKLIYKLSLENNMGGRSIASYLNTHGYKDKSKSENGWLYSTINYMLNNIMYKGYFHMYSKLYEKEIISPIQEHLIIIPEDIWNKNQDIIKNRINKGVELCFFTDKNRSNEAYIRYVWLLAYLCQYHKLNPQKDIIGHETLDPKRKIDPSNGLSYSGHTFKGLIADVQKEYDSLCGNNEISEELKKALEILSTKKIEGDVIMNSPMYWESAIQNKEVNFTWLEALIIKTATYLQKI